MDKKRIALVALLLVAVSVSSAFLGSWMATGNWNPWGHKRYYALLEANMCSQVNEGPVDCEHNVVYNTGATWLQAQFTDTNPTGGGEMKFIALSNNGATPVAGDSVSTIECGGAGNQLTTNGGAATAGAIVLGSGASPQTLTISNTFTATGGGFTAQKSCLMNQATVDASQNTFASSLFTSATLLAGDTIAITWTLTFSF